jgi:integrase
MPKKYTIEPHPYCGGGYRVLVPKALLDKYGGRRAHYFKTREQAEEFCKELNQGNSPVREFQCLSPQEQEVAMRAVRLLGSHALELDQAAVDHLHQKLNQPAETGTVRAAIPLVIADKRAANCRERSVRQLESSLNIFARTFGDREVHTIAREEILNWSTSHNWAPKTRRNKLMDVSALFTFCWKIKGWCKANPVSEISKPGKANKDIAPPILKPNQCALLLRAALEHDPELVGYLALCLFAGLRPQECERLRPADVRLDDKEIVVSQANAKSRNHRDIPMQPVLRQWLKAYPFKMPLKNLRRRFETVRVYAGLIRIKPTRKKRRDGTPGPAPCEFVTTRPRACHCSIIETGWGHDCMRHSFGSYHLQHFRDAAETALVMGHGDQTQTLFAHYRALVTKAEAKQFWSLTPEAVRKTPIPAALAEHLHQVEREQLQAETQARAEAIQRVYGKRPSVPLSGLLHKEQQVLAA